MEPRKDVATLVGAFSRLSAADDLPHRLVLVGPAGWMAERRAGPARRWATGWCSPDKSVRGELRSAYRGAEVFALPSRHEGFGLPVLEAMAQATPVLCSDLPVLRDRRRRRDLRPVGDVDRGRRARATPDDEPDARPRVGGPHARPWFTWERSAAEHLAVYRSV
jgi:glycosyltransferase involved in cell wall biosynthesis